MSGIGMRGAVPAERAVAVGEVRVALHGARRVVVLDDDPTGTQTVRDVPVVTRWDPGTLRWAFEQPTPGFFILTNTRSLSAADAAALTRSIAAACLAVAEEMSVDIAFASRSDSTLRGHFPLETDVLSEVCAAHGRPIDAVFLVPAYIDAGRLTVDGVQWVEVQGTLVPAADTPFAADATFGYRSSRLDEWVEEKSSGRIPSPSVQTVTLGELRTGDISALADRLTALSGGVVVIVEAATDDDLRAATIAILRAESRGRRFLYRTGPSFVRARLGQAGREPVADERLRDILADRRRTGLIVVGSHVPLTTRQLERLRSSRPLPTFTIDVASLVRDDDEAAEEMSARVSRALETSDVILETSRELVRGENPEDSLAIARRVSRRLTDVVRDVVRASPPRFIVAKGGITSSDVATEGLGIRVAWVRGPLLPGIVSLWQAPDDDAIPYAVFAGNVGDEDALVDVIERLSA